MTTLGKILDPDRGPRARASPRSSPIAIYGAVPWWFAIATLAREVAGLRARSSLLASLGAARIDVVWLGKAGTFGLMTAYPLLLMAHGPATWQSVLYDVAWPIGWIGLAPRVDARRSPTCDRHARRSRTGAQGRALG